MGGTHSDGVLIYKNKIIRREKILSDSENPEKTIVLLLKKIIENINFLEIKRIVISTTLITNILSKNQEEKTGLLLIPGLGLSLENFKNTTPFTFILKKGYIDHRGVEVSSLNQDELSEAAVFFQNENIKKIAVVSKFSTRNPDLEKKAGDFLEKKRFQIYYAHRYSGKLNFLRRAMTAGLTASVETQYRNMALALKKSIEEMGIKAPLYILKADGGAVLLEDSLSYPLESVLSGPAGSILGTLFFKNIFQDVKEAVVLDIGGTTTDLGFFIHGEPILEPEGISIKKSRTLIRALKVYPLAIGGDTLFEINPENEVKLDNRRKGVSYCFGGSLPTLTDALIYREKKDLKAKEGLKIKLNEEKLDEQVNKIVLKACDFIYQKISDKINEINEKPIYTINEFFERKNFLPEKIILIGGGAPYFKKALEERFGIPAVIPEESAICNALGAALARVTAEVNLYANTSDGRLSISELQFFEKIDRHFSKKEAEEKALEKLKELAEKKGVLKDSCEMEITESSVFNMVRGFSTTGKNIRIKAQIKPGLIKDF